MELAEDDRHAKGRLRKDYGKRTGRQPEHYRKTTGSPAIRPGLAVAA